MITSRLYAADGGLISEFSKEKRIFVPINNIPKNLINAFLAAEDANFYKHSGIDLFAIFRTSLTNAFGVLSGEGSMGGASTITQQVVKNFLLTRERTFQRKIKEAILAYRMSKSFPKERILELYLNQIYLGSGAYGVAAAAQIYFDKSIDELTLEDCEIANLDISNNSIKKISFINTRINDIDMSVNKIKELRKINKLYDNVLFMHPFYFNSTYRSSYFLFGKIFDSIINKKVIRVGSLNTYKRQCDHLDCIPKISSCILSKLLD
jgi:penicillin-binding protein 1A